MKKASIKTIGCKTNFADSKVLDATLRKLGIQMVPFGMKADFVIVNSCVVTHRAEADSRRALSKGKRESPGARTVLTGCGAHEAAIENISTYADTVLTILQQSDEEALRALLGIDAVTRNSEGSEKLLQQGRDRSRIFIKIQNGCNNNCTYCIVPTVRGGSVSRHHAQILDEIVACENEGYPEVVLTGNHIGNYKSGGKEGLSLSSLVESAIRSTRKVRVRLSSIEVDEVDDDLLEMLASEKRLCNHLHIPLQSGDDRILRRMGRWYSTDTYKNFLEKIKNRSEMICIGTDIITGFPGETDESFEKTFRFFRSLPVDYVHVFPFSQRTGTKAKAMTDQVPERKKRERTERLLREGEEKKKKFVEGFIGKTLEVVTEKVSPYNGLAQGTSDNYIKVVWKGSASNHPELVRVHIEERDGDKAVGTYRRGRN